MKNRSDQLRWVIIICLVFMTSSLLHGYFSITARGWLWIPLACVACLKINSKVLRSKQFTWMSVYFGVLFLNMLLGKTANTNNFLVMNFAILLWAVSFPFVLRYGMNRKFVRLFVLIEMSVIIITAILTIAVDMIIPGVVRQAVTYVNDVRSDLAVGLYRMGVCEYGLPHAIPIIIPAIVKQVRDRHLSLYMRMCYVLLLLLLSYFVFISDVSTAIILLAFAIIGSFLISKVSRTKTYSRMIILLIIAMPFFSESVVLSTLSEIEYVVPTESSFHGKIISIENSILYDQADGSVEARESVYKISWRNFLENPIIGGFVNVKAGGHSVILDTFGSFGVVGGIPLVLLILYQTLFIYRMIPAESKMFFIIGAICFIVMLATKNMSNVYTWMFFSALLPLLLFYNSKKM